VKEIAGKGVKNFPEFMKNPKSKINKIMIDKLIELDLNLHL